MTLQIFILGALSEGDRHPYDIKKSILRALDNSMSINDGTLYYNFEAMAKKGLIRVSEVVHSENRPDKTLYSITDKGLKALEDNIYSAFQKMTSVTSLYASLLFLDKVDKKKVAYLIEEAIERLTKSVNRIKGSDGEFHEVPEEKREAIRLVADHALHKLENDVAWLRRVLESIRRSSET